MREGWKGVACAAPIRFRVERTACSWVLWVRAAHRKCVQHSGTISNFTELFVSLSVSLISSLEPCFFFSFLPISRRGNEPDAPALLPSRLSRLINRYAILNFPEIYPTPRIRFRDPLIFRPANKNSEWQGTRQFYALITVIKLSPMKID